MKIKLFDLSINSKKIVENFLSKFRKLLKNSDYILGKDVKYLENKLSSFVNRKHCISCSSGTEALVLSLRSLDIINKNDLVITTSFTWISSASAILLSGATPLFVDVDPQTCNIDLKKLEKLILAIKNRDNRIHPLPKKIFKIKDIKIKAMISVNLYGNMCDYDQIQKICKENKIFLIEDAAQSFGATYNNKKSGSLGDISCTSFFPTKPLGGMGDGGAIFCDNLQISKKILALRVHGEEKKNFHKYLGTTGRLDTIQAIAILEKFKTFSKELKKRIKIARIYNKKFNFVNGIKLPNFPKNSSSAYALYTLICANEKHRNDITKRLVAKNIGFGVYYKRPLHIQKVFNKLGYKKKDFPNSIFLSLRVLSIPLHAKITKREAKIVSDTIIN
jgi:UDP-2-acetamido-2-deoxy-ribo-hexuluronate aminotransferase